MVDVRVEAASPPGGVAALEDSHGRLPSLHAGSGHPQELGLGVGLGALEGVAKVEIDPFGGVGDVVDGGEAVLVEEGVVDVLEGDGLGVVGATQPSVQGRFVDAGDLGGGLEVVALEDGVEDAVDEVGGELGWPAGDLE